MEEYIKVLDDFKGFLKEEFYNADIYIKALENILNRLEEQNNNINNTIKAIEILRQDFSEDLQVEFIILLNTLTGGEYLK